MPVPLHPSPYNPRRASCEVCWADTTETDIYRYEGSTFCEDHLWEVKNPEEYERQLAEKG
jgi:recombinational DNA repair protein (RecF pathway)